MGNTGNYTILKEHGGSRTDTWEVYAVYLDGERVSPYTRLEIEAEAMRRALELDYAVPKEKPVTKKGRGGKNRGGGVILG